METQSVASAIELDLTSWRKLEPAQIESREDDYIALLVKLTNPLIGDDAELRYLLASAAGSRGSRCSSTALLLAERLDATGSYISSDLVCSWLAVAAIVHDSDDFAPSAARMFIALKLLARAKDGDMWTGPLYSQREANRIRRLAFTWVDCNLRPELVYPRHLRGTLERMGRVGAVVLEKMATAIAPPDKSAKPGSKFAANVAKIEAQRKPGILRSDLKPTTAAETPAFGGPTMIVCQEIMGQGTTQSGITNGSNDKHIIATWKFLTQPVALAAGPDPALLESVLLAEFPWMGAAIAAIVGDLKLRRSAGHGHAHWRPVLLVGPAGSGKTRFARRLAQLIGTGFGEVCASGSSDNRALMGTARAYGTASPTLVLHAMRTSKTANPVLLVDELDKAGGSSRNGDIKQTLLTMLEPISAQCWPDECLMAPVDLSQVNWIATANEANPLRGALLTRLRIVDVPLPKAEHFDSLLAGIRRDLAADLGVDDLPTLPSEIEQALKAGFARGVSIRRVQAAVEGALQAGGGLELVRH